MAASDATPLLRWDVGSPVNSVSVSNDGTRIASGSDDGHMRIWDVRTGSLVLGPLKGHNDFVQSVAWSHDDSRVVSGSDDGSIRIWDSRTGALIGKPLIGHTHYVYSVAFSSDSTRLISGSSDHTIRAWDACTGVLMGEPFIGHGDDVRSVAFSHDSTRVVSGSADNTVRIWDAHTGTPIGEPLRGHTGHVYSTRFSDDGARIISGSEDNTIRTWDAPTGAPIGEPLRGHTQGVLSVAFSHSGTHIVSGSKDRTIRIWDTRTGASIGEALTGHTNFVYSVQFFSNSSRIVSGSEDGTICVWEVPQKTRLNMVSSSTYDQGIFEGLVEHGCSDLSSTIDSSQFASYPVNFTVFDDIQQARTSAGAAVAVRFLRLRPVQEGGEKAVKRLTDQLQYWSKAKYDNIQKLLGIFMFQDRLGMVSPWIVNETLQDYVRNHPSVDRYSLCVQVAKGVSYLHSIGIIHGDIRLTNVSISGGGVAKLSSFDHSIVLEYATPLTQTIEHGPKTLRWMAPELLRKEEEDGPPVMRNKQTDVYALGMTMLEILTGRVPYCEYRFEMAVYGALYRKELPQRPKELPEEGRKERWMWELLMACWSYEPSRRLDAEDIAPAMKVFARRDQVLLEVLPFFVLYSF